MTTLRPLVSGLLLCGLLSFFFVACGGDAGSKIPDPPPPPVAPTADPAPSSPPAVAPAGSVSLVVTVQGTGAVRSQPAGIDCPGTCSATFPPGTRVTLVPVPAEGWRLDGWRGACAGSGACAVQLDADSTVTSTLALVDPRWDPAVGVHDCASAWGVQGEKLSACDTTKDDYVVVHKSTRNVALCTKGALVKNFRSGLGFAPTGAKEKLGDGKTPEGVFYIPRLVPDSQYHKAFLLSYPTPQDAQRGVASQLITAEVRAQIESASTACTEPPQTTALGGELELLGSGSGSDWTTGSIALDDASVDLLWTTIGVGDTIVVIP